MIKLEKIDIDPSDYPDFKELCNAVYRFVASNADVTYFDLSMEFPLRTYPLFDEALLALLTNYSLINGSKGYLIGIPPEFKEPKVKSGVQSNDSSISNQSSLDSNVSDSWTSRISHIRSVDYNVHNALNECSFYYPDSIVDDDIRKMRKSTTRTILEEFFIKNIDLDVLYKTYRSQAEKTISDYSLGFHVDSIDEDLYGKYDLSSNIFLYIFNRHSSYHRLFMVRFDPGFGDISELLFPSGSNPSLYVHTDPNNDGKLNASDRVHLYLTKYMEMFGRDLRQFVEALVGLFNNVSIEKRRIQDIYKQFFPSYSVDVQYDVNWELAMEDYIEHDDAIKFLSSDNIDSINDALTEIKELDYGITVDKLFSSNQQMLSEYYIDTSNELKDFITKYTPYQFWENRILRSGSITDAVSDFVRDVQVYDFNRLCKIYSRRCGGPTKNVEPILESLDLESFSNDHPLTDEESEKISAKLSQYQWLTRDNANSIFADLHDIEHKFNEINMHKLGFTSLSDVYYRCEYSSFAECISKTEFIGEDLYIDDRKFKLKMESSAFQMEVEHLQRSMRWIPISRYRYINLRAPKYQKFAQVLFRYRDIVFDLCKKQFITPYSLKNMTVGIPEIDEDDYDLEFYDAILLATKANHQTFNRYRFYFVPTDSTSFNPTAPEFIRFIVYNNNGSASVDEIQDILRTQYGILSDKAIIRNQIKSSSCIFSTVTDAAYLDDETYTEALRNE
ncbi:MAG: hypothetical protein IKQ67_07245 [Candidatus Methanomethylophilaceae archaeon]|nr:hypothetical protein [Candidatus Methanomethylophilaceae archaeon]